MLRNPNTREPLFPAIADFSSRSVFISVRQQGLICPTTVAYQYFLSGNFFLFRALQCKKARFMASFSAGIIVALGTRKIVHDRSPV
jgi:hypothetical protein